MIRLGRWRPRHLLLSWCAYWIALILITMWPAISAALRLSNTPNSHGNAGVSFANGVLNASISQEGQTLWTGSISFLSLVLLLAGPPLALWAAWLLAASRTNNADEETLTNSTRAREIQRAEPRKGIVDTSTSKYPEREES